MNINKIKEALKARAKSLNVEPQAVSIPISSIVVKAETPKDISPIISPVKSDKTPQNTAPFVTLFPNISAQIQPTKTTVENPVKETLPVAPFPTEKTKPPAEKSGRKAAVRVRKVKENPASPATIAVNDIESIVAKHLRAGRDYDRLPNTTKPTLLKSGAEILADVFNFRTTAKVINRVTDYDKQFVLYEVQVTVYDNESNIVAEGLGLCNSRERKYLKTDFATNLNTVLKIAKKRAFVDAILTATHASKVFTQDIEDILNLQIVNDDEHVAKFK